MSLYDISDAKGSTPSKAASKTTRVPRWLLVLALYIALMTIINRGSTLLAWMEIDALEPGSIGYILGEVTGLFSAAMLIIFLIFRSTWCVYYLIVISVIEFARTALGTVAGDPTLNPYYYAIKGLDSIPDQIVGWTLGWEGLSDNLARIIQFTGSALSLTVCVLLWYWHEGHSLPANKSS